MGLVRTAKEVARHLLHSLSYRRQQDHLAGASRADRFSAIYQDGVWSFGRSDIPLSGTGSSLEATANLRSALPELVRRLKVETLVDIGCGDYHWMSSIDLPCDYVGVDIVPWLIERNNERYGSDKVRFQRGDIVAGPGPRGDLLLCREVLFHLSLEDGMAALRNMAASGCSHLLLTTDRATAFNAQIETGDFRLINLERSPYRLPPPQERIEDDVISKGRFVGLWAVDEIRRAMS